ncbi:hypothetical protein OHB12_28065 [Nocardia sp. NBC_01730]|uniref:hypothetical protein n=1 Tax=Nocardia sp. NBC_01730 TaxID=2975998 RepID=UPI002E1093EE|nr:hypothetical protein OHB12_28065 [Nocardia sp. NBC_01730]
MTEPADEALMTADQQALLRAVVDAVNDAARPVTPAEIARFLADRIHPAPSLDDITTVVHILELPTVAFQRGVPSAVVLARILDVLDAAVGGEEYTQPSADIDDRY